MLFLLAIIFLCSLFLFPTKVLKNKNRLQLIISSFFFLFLPPLIFLCVVCLEKEDEADRLRMNYAAQCGDSQISKHVVMEFVTYMVMKGADPRVAEVSMGCTQNTTPQQSNKSNHLPLSQYPPTQSDGREGGRSPAQGNGTHDGGGVL